MIFKNLFLILFLIVALSGCGKSPFLKLDDAKAELPISGREILSKKNLLNFSKANMKVEVVWPALPVTDQLISLYLLFFNEKNEMISPSEIDVVPTMPEMGHGTSPVIVGQLSPGLFKIDEIFFSMNGKWEIEIRIKNNGIKDSAKFEINL